jgi:hypothetical protein
MNMACDDDKMRPSRHRNCSTYSPIRKVPPTQEPAKRFGDVERAAPQSQQKFKFALIISKNSKL